LRRADARDVEEVLDGDGEARENPALPERFFHHFPGMCAGAVEAAGGQRVDGAVHLRHPLFQRIEAVEGRDGAGFQAIDDCRGGHPDQVCHAIPLARAT
jgi:hypothetical protein